MLDSAALSYFVFPGRSVVLASPAPAAAAAIHFPSLLDSHFLGASFWISPQAHRCALKHCHCRCFMSALSIRSPPCCQNPLFLFTGPLIYILFNEEPDHLSTFIIPSCTWDVLLELVHPLHNSHTHLQPSPTAHISTLFYFVGLLSTKAFIGTSCTF